MGKMIQLRHVPDDLHKKLKARAALEGLSLSDYLLQEVRRVAERPTIAELRHPSRYRDAGRRRWQGIEYVMHEYHVGEHRIWGATARMLHELLALWAPPA